MRHWIDLVETSQENPLDSPQFKNWFRDSKVVAPDGSPLVVYHGTGHDFTAFDPERDPYTYETDRGKFFFTTDLEHAREYAKTGDQWGSVVHKTPRIIAAYISLQNPFIIDNSDEPVNEWDQWGHLYGREAVEGGHDGIIIHTEDAREWLVIAFQPHQIKEITNTVFDPNSPNIHE